MQRAGSVSAPDSSVVLLPTAAAGCLAVDDPVPVYTLLLGPGMESKQVFLPCR